MKNLSTTYNLYLLAAFLGLFSLMPGCTRQPADRTKPVDPVVKKYFNYQPGTYWIYRDTLTAQVYTFVVESNVRSTNHFGGQSWGNTMGIGIYNGAQHEKLYLYIAFDDHLIRQLLYVSQKPSLYVEFSYPYGNPGPAAAVGNQRKQIYSFDTFTHITNYDELQTYKMAEDFCTSAGILKMNTERSTARRFELVRYHLVR